MNLMKYNLVKELDENELEDFVENRDSLEKRYKV